MTVADQAPTGEAVRGERLSWLTRITYSLGNAAETVKTISFELLVLFYYTQVLGLSGSLAGIAVAVSLIADAILHPLIGAWSDSLKGLRFGRRITPMLYAIIPTCISIVLLFNPPAGLDQIGLFLWLTVTAVAMRGFFGLHHVPYSALTPELSTNPNERATLATIRALLGSLMQFLLIGAAFSYFFAKSDLYERGQENPEAYLPYALFAATAVAVMILISCFGTLKRMRAVEAEQTIEGRRVSLSSMVTLWRQAMVEHANFRWLFLGSLAYFVMFSSSRSFGVYIGTYFYDLPTEAIGQWQQAIVPGSLVAVLTAFLLIKRFGPRGPFLFGVVASTAVLALPVLLMLLGLLPDPTQGTGFWILIACQIVVGYGAGMLLVVSNVMYAEVTDEFQVLTNSSQAGMLLGLSWFGITAASGIGKLIAGFILDFIDFPTGVTADAVPQAASDALAWAFVALTLGVGLLGFLAYMRYNMPRARYREIAAALGRPIDE